MIRVWVAALVPLPTFSESPWTTVVGLEVRLVTSPNVVSSNSNSSTSHFDSSKKMGTNIIWVITGHQTRNHLLHHRRHFDSDHTYIQHIWNEITASTNKKCVPMSSVEQFNSNIARSHYACFIRCWFRLTPFHSLRPSPSAHHTKTLLLFPFDFIIISLRKSQKLLLEKTTVIKNIQKLCHLKHITTRKSSQE